MEAFKIELYTEYKTSYDDSASAEYKLLTNNITNIVSIVLQCMQCTQDMSGRNKKCP